MDFSGGHSGKEIGENRGNPIIVLGKILSILNSQNEVYLNSIDAGSWVTAIPRTASSTITTESLDLETLNRIFSKLISKLREDHCNQDINISINEIPNQSLAFDSKTSQDFIHFITDFPNGVILADKKDNVPLLSTNLGTVWVSDGKLLTENSIRSNCNSSITEQLISKIRDFENKHRLSVTETFDFPGYEQTSECEFIKYLSQQYNNTFNRLPNLKKEHVLLECAWFAQKKPNLEYVSISPDIENPHSPFERVSISSMQRTWSYLKNVVRDLDRYKTISDINSNNEKER